MNDIEERLRILEQSRYRLLARFNLLQTLAVGAWLNIVFKTESPREVAEALAESWRQGAEALGRFTGEDPAKIAVLDQEYKEGLEEFLLSFLAEVNRRAPK